MTKKKSEVQRRFEYLKKFFERFLESVEEVQGKKDQIKSFEEIYSRYNLGEPEEYAKLGLLCKKANTLSSELREYINDIKSDAFHQWTLEEVKEFLGKRYAIESGVYGLAGMARRKNLPQLYAEMTVGKLEDLISTLEWDIMNKGGDHVQSESFRNSNQADELSALKDESSACL